MPGPMELAWEAFSLVSGAAPETWKILRTFLGKTFDIANFKQFFEILTIFEQISSKLMQKFFKTSQISSNLGNLW